MKRSFPKTNLQPPLSADKLAENLKKEWQKSFVAFIGDVSCLALISIHPYLRLTPSRPYNER